MSTTTAARKPLIDNTIANTDTQSLSISGHTISLTNGGSVTVPDNYRSISDSISSTSTSVSASSKAVKIAYDKGNHPHPYLPLSGGTLTGDLVISKTSPMLRLYDTNASTGNYPRIDFDTANNQGASIEFNEFDAELPIAGYGLVVGPSTTNTQFPTTGTLSLSVLGEIYAGGTSLKGLNKVFHDGYHPNADKWTTARTLSLTGDVTGSVSWDGSGNASITATVDGLQTALDSKLNSTSYTAADVLTKIKTVDGAGSGLDADLLDGYDSSRFMRRTGKGNAIVGGGWMTVATCGGGRFHGEIIVTDADSGDHAFIRIDWMRSYIDSNFTVLNCGGHTNRIQGARVLYNTSDNTYGTKYLQVYVTAYSSYEVNVYELGDIADYGVPSVVTPVIQNSISGYAVHGNEITGLDTYGHAAEEGIIAGGPIRSNNSMNVSGNTVWHAGNDGAGSGLDADTLDGIQGSEYIKRYADLAAAIDLNTITTTGIYHQNSSAQASSGSNYPVGQAGLLEVYNNDEPGGNALHTYQRYTEYSTGNVWTRQRYHSTWYAWAKQWDSTNDGSGSGLDADKLDGLDSSAFAPASHNHTSLTGVTSISFAAQATDSMSISRTINATGTYFDFNLSDDNNNDWWRWRFNPTGSTVYDAMTLKPVSNGNSNLTVNGTIRATGDVISNSDIRLKSDIKPINNPIETVKALNGKTYIKDDKASIGLIAQEVEEVLPQLVHTASDEMGTKSVAYGNIVAVLIEAVKEQQKQIDELKEKLNGI